MAATVQRRRESVPESTGRTFSRLSGVREIELRGGEVATVDQEDYPRIAGMPWRLKARGKHRYAAACVRTGSGPHDWEYVYLHRVLCGLEKGDGLCVDHIDGDALNNRRDNLRVCSLAENSKNRGLTKGRRGFKGVSEHRGRFIAKYCTDYLGVFDSAIEAALAYNAESAARCGEFSRPNLIQNEDGARKLIAERDQLLRKAEQISRELQEWSCE